MLGERALDRGRRHRLADQRLHGRMNVLDLHRLTSIGQYLDDGFEHPARPARPLPTTRRLPPRPAAGPNSRQFLSQMAQRAP